MTTNDDRIEIFLTFSKLSMKVYLTIAILLGGTVLSIMLAPNGAVGNYENLLWWLLPVAVVFILVTIIGVRRRRWPADAPEVQILEQDEWRRKNLEKAIRYTLIIVLLMQWPLGLMFAFWFPIALPRATMIMAAATIVTGLITLISLFLVFDRD